jgi:hypothetical protein
MNPFTTPTTKLKHKQRWHTAHQEPLQSQTGCTESAHKHSSTKLTQEVTTADKQ